MDLMPQKVFILALQHHCILFKPQLARLYHTIFKVMLLKNNQVTTSEWLRLLHSNMATIFIQKMENNHTC